MSNSETSNLEQLILRHVLTTAAAPLNPSDFNTVRDRITSERIKLESQLTDLLCSAIDDTVIIRKLRVNHVILVQLSNKIYQVIKADAGSGTSNEMAQMALENINELMTTAHTLAYNYIAVDIPLSHYFVHLQGNQLHAEYIQLRLALEPVVDQEMTRALTRYYDRLINPSDELYESDFRYAEKLTRGLQKMMAAEPDANWNIQLWHLMLYFNFNQRDIMAYSEAKVRGIALSNEPYLMLQEKLLTFLKEVKQVEENPIFKYQKERISLKAYVIDLLEQELNWLQQQRTNLLAEIANSDDNYIIIDLSVRRLNLWAQINVEMGTIPYHSTPHVVKVMSNYVRTLKPGPISYESARRKMDAYDATTVKGLHNWLSAQLTHLEKKYSEQLQFNH